MAEPERKRILMKMIILGDSGVGKTSIMNRFVMGRFSVSYKSTIGADFLTKEITIDRKTVCLQIWDTAGQERFYSLGYSFYRGADCCVLVFDLNKASSFDNLVQWYDEVLEKGAIRDAANFPFVVLGNKVDIANSRTVSQEKALKWCQEKGFLPYFETSAKDNINIDQAIHVTAKLALQRMELNAALAPEQEQPVVNNNVGYSYYCQC